MYPKFVYRIDTLAAICFYKEEAKKLFKKENASKHELFMAKIKDAAFEDAGYLKKDRALMAYCGILNTWYQQKCVWCEHSEAADDDINLAEWKKRPKMSVKYVNKAEFVEYKLRFAVSDNSKTHKVALKFFSKMIKLLEKY